MRHTDYQVIAARYDEATERHDIAVEPLLGELAAGGGQALAVLDLGCGTGNWLEVQRRAYPEPSIRWHGLDASEAMLAQARGKLTAAGEGAAVDLRSGRAEALPYPDGAFDLVACRFAFHHFVDKHRALDELARVLRPAAAVVLANVAPERMTGWWVYRFFPHAWLHDEERYWSVELLTRELERRGFEVGAEVHTRLRRVPAERILARASRRDVSSLAIVDDDHYRAGMAQLQALARHGAAVQDTVAVACWRARRRGAET